MGGDWPGNGNIAHSKNDIEQLSDDVKEFYLLYNSISEENSGHLNEEDVLAVVVKSSK